VHKLICEHALDQGQIRLQQEWLQMCASQLLPANCHDCSMVPRAFKQFLLSDLAAAHSCSKQRQQLSQVAAAAAAWPQILCAKARLCAQAMMCIRQLSKTMQHALLVDACARMQPTT
jgi:hypothetical protein